MKRILLTSTALVAFAGAAAAEVSFSGDAELGFNDKFEDGMFWSMGLTIKAEQELNNGITAGFKLDVDLDDSDSTFKQDAIKTSDFVLYLTTDVAGLYFGDTGSASEELWAGTTNMKQDSFNDGDEYGADATIRAELEMSNIKAALSYAVEYTNDGNDDGADDTNDDEIFGMQIGATYDAGAYNFGLVYQEEVTGTADEVFGIWAGGSFSGADVKLAYAKNNTADEDSIGVEVSYPFGPVTGTVFYSAESAGDDNYGIELAYENGPVGVDFWYHGGDDEEIGLEGSYDVGNGLMLYAGFIQNDGDSDATETYIAGEYDLGGGATLLVSYGDAGDTYGGDRDEIGDNFEVREGTTVSVSFDF